MITQTINLNLIPGGVLPRINVSQYDKGARTLQFNLYNGVTPFTIPDGSSVYVVGTKADKTGFDYTASYSGGLVSIDVTEQMTAFAGDVEIEIRIINSGEQIATGNFVLCVERTALADDTVISETDIPIIQHLPELVAETEENAELAHKWATFGDESEEPSATNNAKYWAEQAALIAHGSADNISYDPTSSDLSATNVQDAIDEVVTDVKSQNSLLKSTVGWTGKNKLENKAVSETVNGITFTVNPDKSVKVNGTATANTFFAVNTQIETLVSGTQYVISGEANGSADSQYIMYLQKVGSSPYWLKRMNGQTITYENDGLPLSCYIAIYSGQTVSNLVFKPMLCTPEEYSIDPSYEPYHESVEVVHEEDVYGVNLARNTYTHIVGNGVTWTYNNNDGTVRANGTATGNSTYFLSAKNTNWNYAAGTVDYLPIGRYILSNKQTSLLAGVFLGLVVVDSSNNQVFSVSASGGEEKEFEVTQSGLSFILYARVADGVTINNYPFYPMIYKEELGSNLPYHKFNNQSIQNQLNNITGELTVRNLLQNTAVTATNNGVTFTVNTDGSITVNGTATGEARFNVHIGLTLKAGRYILSGTPSGGSADTYWMFYTDHGQDRGNGLSIDLPTEFTGNVTIGLKTGYTANNLIYKPMLRLASDPDPTFVPYAMTNRELTSGISSLNSSVSTLNTKVANYSGRFVGNQIGISLGNVAKTKFTIYNCKYVVFRLDVSFGPLSKIGTYYMFKQTGSPGYLIHDIGKDTDIIIGTDMIITSLDDSTLEFKFPNATTGLLAAITVLGTNANPYVETGTYT